MGWSIGYDDHWERDIGYGVPAICDHPLCSAEIDRGISHVCGAQPYGGDEGCGLYFCGKHQVGQHQRCERCARDNQPFDKKPDAAIWTRHKLADKSWAPWRAENKATVRTMKAALAQAAIAEQSGLNSTIKDTIP